MSLGRRPLLVLLALLTQGCFVTGDTGRAVEAARVEWGVEDTGGAEALQDTGGMDDRGLEIAYDETSIPPVRPSPDNPRLWRP
jgi:hypothetical protein